MRSVGRIELTNILKTLESHGAAWRRKAEPLSRRLPRPLRRLLIAVAGGVLVATGVVLLVLPGPGLLTIAVGVAVLATEFAWARGLVARIRRKLPGRWNA